MKIVKYTYVDVYYTKEEVDSERDNAVKETGRNYVIQELEDYFWDLTYTYY